ncbi:uncharacterized protein K444DRAFT_721190 [Hyaloscypha bicolor E]|uniref:Uncharacterized protein n=1 Tax=Hyaloscypha bicolor E TaxID=1095630 RepID=A0A2J6TCP7_9HELO|nr:uncharacterized protein K444DRAFT_721190 [Hyaloscypha bicolor E]PMD60752.1 hypothetical protein K444DRAFT_721190 [Hyaloscypha bicolor E]
MDSDEFDPEPLSQPSGAVPPRRKSTTLSRVFSGLSITRRSSESSEDKRGKFGLTLICDRADPIVDIVFVHGLGGGSRKTWCKGDDPGLYWPKEWLQRDPEFKNVRTYGFGYDSDWDTRRGSQLDVHDFGKALLSALLRDPYIRRSQNLPIILVAHSMGGLVIKKAYLLSRNDPTFLELGKRFYSMYFLATPHHGAASAELLSFVLRASFSGSLPFLADLHQDSPSIQQINDEFRHCALQLSGGIYSFYETQPTSLFGIGERIIVKKSSAMTGLPNEQSAPLNANHRGVCKFSSPSDDNFLAIRNSFLINVDKIKEAWDLKHREQLRNQKRQLKRFLCISEQLEDGLIDTDEPRADGSCEWLVTNPKFRQWRDSSSTNPLFWLSGRPATGKTFLTNHVREHLNELGADCSTYFFREGDKTLSALSSCLLSLAYQMACSNVAIRQAFLEMQEDDVRIDRDNYQSIWRKLFQGGIFRTTLYKSHYWVIDALDECKSPVNFFQLILKTEHTFPLRIFVSSRPSNELHSQLHGMEPPAQIHLILPTDTLQDIRWYVQNHTDFPSMQNHKTHQQLVDTLVEKSEGVFLWVKLVLKELRQVYSETTLKRILEDIPKGMDKLYSRSLEPLTKDSYGTPLAKAILTWTACAVRPLSTTELKFALQLHIQDNVYNLENQIATLCGHLVYVDPQYRVLMVHQTARSFLLTSRTNSEFAFLEQEGHRHLALTCLKQLVHDDLKAPQSRRPSANLSTTSRSPFLDYAAKSWYEHVNKASSADTELLNLIYKFLSCRHGNVLTWIEHIASAGDLHHLIQTGMVLRTYLKRRAIYFPIIKKEVETIDSWSTDFIRIASKFGRNLLRSPPSIYHIIPPLCPREAAPYQQFGRSTRGISVLGLSTTSWDDCLATIAYHKSTATAVACGTAHFAIGASDKMVRLYTTSTCQEYGKMAHGEAIRMLEFNNSGQMLASAGRQLIRVWDVADKKLIAEFKSPRPGIAMTFTPDNKSLMAACHDNQMHTFDIARSENSESEPWYIDVDSEPIYRVPDTAAFSLEHKLLAVVYRGSHIHIWSWEDGYLGCCKKPQADQELLPFHASSLCFNPAPEANSLAAAYEGGTILIFDPVQEDGNIKASHKADTDTQTLACSPCGRTLISGNSRGTIRIFDFEAFDHLRLKLLYVIHDRDNNIRSLAFCADSLRFVDMGGQQTNIWEPTVLVRHDVSEEMSETASIEVQEMCIPQAAEIDVITTMCVESSARHIFCGTEGGSVKVFSLTTGKQLRTLYIHSNGVGITQLSFSGNKAILASADSASRVLIWQLAPTSDSWKANSLLLEQRMEDPVENILFNPYETHLLIVTTLIDKLFALSDPASEPISLTWTTRNAGIWAQHPTNRSQLLLIVRSTLRIYTWNSLGLLTASTGIPLHVEDYLPSDFEIRAFHVGWAGRILATEYSALSQSRSHIRLLLWSAGLLVPETERLGSVMGKTGEGLAGLVGTLGMIICMTDSLILFLDDDGWVCSLDVGEVGSRLTSYKRHFFLPYDWLSTNDELLCKCSEKGDIIFAKDDELAVIRKGLECGEIIEFNN